MNASVVSTLTLQLVFAALVALAWATGLVGGRRPESAGRRLLPGFIGAYSLLQIGIIVYLWSNHASFPLNLEAMELTILAHVRRVLAGLPIYVPASSNFTPLVYTPLYYVLAAPLARIIDPDLLALRLVAIVGMLGCGVVLYLAVRRETNSIWWGLAAAGLFAASYRAMDTYLDNAHADSWMLFSALLGCYLVSLNRSRGLNLLGLFFAVLSFWLKQPGAVFAAGIVAYLTLRDGLRRSWFYWLLAALLGPGLYLLIPEQWTGPFLHYYTWSVPRQWIAINLAGARRLVAYYLRSYPLLAASAGVWAIARVRASGWRVNIWVFMLPFALMTAISGAMDSESNNNVFIPLATWLILTGALALHAAQGARTWIGARGLSGAVVGASFVLLAYNPWTVIVSPQAGAAYADLQVYLQSLDGAVYAPWIGPLQDGYAFTPAIHWVPMTDVVRAPGKDLTNDPTIRTLLDPVVHPAGRAYILTNIPLEQDSALSFLTGEYVLEADLGARFQALSTIPKRYELGWPRYLYVYRQD
jgi:hypothetical protein